MRGCNSRKVEVEAIGVAKVAEEVIPSEVAEQLVVVDEPRLAKLAQRVAAVRRVVGVALAAVRRQLGARVVATLVRKGLETDEVNASQKESQQNKKL